jgi:hypothetical protein
MAQRIWGEVRWMPVPVPVERDMYLEESKAENAEENDFSLEW